MEINRKFKLYKLLIRAECCLSEILGCNEHKKYSNRKLLKGKMLKGTLRNYLNCM